MVATRPPLRSLSAMSETTITASCDHAYELRGGRRVDPPDALAREDERDRSGRRRRASTRDSEFRRYATNARVVVLNRLRTRLPVPARGPGRPRLRDTRRLQAPSISPSSTKRERGHPAHRESPKRPVIARPSKRRRESAGGLELVPGLRTSWLAAQRRADGRRPTATYRRPAWSAGGPRYASPQLIGAGHAPSS